MKLGETKSEQDVRKVQESRDIVKEILNFGITEEQKLDVIYFLSLELENRDIILEISNLLKKFRSGIKPDEESQYVNKEPGGGKKKLLGV